MFWCCNLIIRILAYGFLVVSVCCAICKYVNVKSRETNINRKQEQCKGMQIFIRYPNGPTSSFQVEPYDTVRRLKMKIENRCKILLKNQRLIYGGKQLKDEHQLTYCGIQMHSTVDLLLRLLGGASNFKLHVIGLDAIVHTITVEKISTVEAVKEALEAAVDKYPRNVQILRYKGRTLENGSSLKDYGLNDGDMIFVDLAHHIHIDILETNGERKYIDTSANTTVKDFKHQIYLQTKIPPANQVLRHKGNTIPNNNTSLTNVGIKDGDLVLCLKQFQPSIWETIVSTSRNWFPFKRMTKFVILLILIATILAVCLAINAKKGFENFVYFMNFLSSLTKLIEYLDLKLY